MAEPAWFTAALDQVSQMASLPAETGVFDLIMLPLTDKGEHNCDCCGKDCSQSGLYVGQHMATHRSGTQLLVVFGVCAEHRAGFED